MNHHLIDCVVKTEIHQETWCAIGRNLTAQILQLGGIQQVLTALGRHGTADFVWFTLNIVVGIGRAKFVKSIAFWRHFQFEALKINTPLIYQRLISHYFLPIGWIQCRKVSIWEGLRVLTFVSGSELYHAKTSNWREWPVLILYP